MDNQNKAREVNQPDQTKNQNTVKGFTFDNYISSFWYGSLIDNSAKMENLKNVYESYRSGFITLEDFNQFITDFNDNKPPARSV